MKRIITICAAILMTASVFSQAPNKMSYQAVIRNSSNALVTSTSIGMRISILQTSSSGTAVYVETQTPTTNANGLASIEIGGGTLVNGNFANINWANGPYFIKTETDPAGGNNYTITGTTQLLSVPYALFSGNGIVGVSATGDTLYLGNGNHIIVPGISASNSGGGQTVNTTHSCGVTNIHNPNLNYGSMTDQDGNTYKTIIIGTQEWMAENLKASHYRNGDLIPVVTNDATWAGLTTGATCWYNNDSATYNCPYGKLYNFYAAADVRNLCPTGWHVPSDTEWNTLIGFLDPSINPNPIGVQSAIAGGLMKSTGTLYWTSPNQDATNASGFSALPDGVRDFDGQNGIFGFVFVYGAWWSSTEPNTSEAWTRRLLFNGGFVERNAYPKLVGVSVRCIRD
jgi:uncharacterized protein (TIGR02145 family)